MTSIIDVVTAARELEGESPAEILRWASKHIGPKLTFATGFGAEGCVIIDLIARNNLPVDVFTLDTGLLFPETYDLWKRLEERYGVSIKGVRPVQTVEEQARTHGEELWKREPERCCGLRKVDPLGPALAGSSSGRVSRPGACRGAAAAPRTRGRRRTESGSSDRPSPGCRG